MKLILSMQTFLKHLNFFFNGLLVSTIKTCITSSDEFQRLVFNAVLLQNLMVMLHGAFLLLAFMEPMGGTFIKGDNLK
jgi:hypothetical protein